MSSPRYSPDDTQATRMLQARAGSLVANLPPLELREISELAAANPLLTAANPLLMMLHTLRVASPPGNVADLRGRLVAMVKDFDAACAKHRIAELEGKIANYALCAVVDECVQMTPWGAAANWAQQSLLIHFHRENWGGEKFFVILNQMSGTPSKYQSLLELYYMCLALGFMGRFHLEGIAGQQTVSDLRERVFQFIRQGRPEVDRTLSTNWQGLEVTARRFRGFSASIAVAVALALGCLGVFSYLYWSLGAANDALALERLALPKAKLAPVAKEPAHKPRLAKLLAPEITSRQLEVRDMQLESIVTLLGESLFDSGSVVPSSLSGPLIEKVADALEQVDGKILVTGYTDNIPTRTLRFPSNWELSRERSSVVAKMLGARLKDPGRISYEGRGESDPVAKNDTPAGRAQNRRVEIVLEAPDAHK